MTLQCISTPLSQSNHLHELWAPARRSIDTIQTLAKLQYRQRHPYRPKFDRIVTPQFSKDVESLSHWIMDIKAVLADNAIKDMMAMEDSAFIAAVNAAIDSAQSLVVARCWYPTCRWAGAWAIANKVDARCPNCGRLLLVMELEPANPKEHAS